MTLANPTKTEVIEAVKGLDADDEMTEVVVHALERLIPEEPSSLLGKRPLVIVYVGGGLVQDTTIHPGEGEPRVYVIDWDREGQYGTELDEFADTIEEARDALAEYFGTVDEVTMLTGEAAKYRELAESGETASRYR